MPTGHLRNLCRQKKRKNVSAYASLIETPEGASVVLPAPGKFSILSVAGDAAGTTAATLAGATNRTIKTPLLDAGERVVIDWLERGVEVTLAAGFELHLDLGLGRWALIAEG